MKIIENWPGGVRARKVPTKISIDQFGEVGWWGFECESHSIHTRELFKIFLDSNVFNLSEQTKLVEPRPKNSAEAADWSYFYLRFLFLP